MTPNPSLERTSTGKALAGGVRSAQTLGVKTVRRTLSTHSSYPDAGQLPTGIDRALRLLIPLPGLIRNDQGGAGWTGATRYLRSLR
jgi:hypothetical protein